MPDALVIPAATPGAIAGYTPAQIRTAYGFSQLSSTGAGQTIAVVDAYSDPNIASDLKTFDTEFSLPSASLSVVSQTGGSVSGVASNAGWATEISLDVEWAHAIAPGANLLLVEAQNSSMTNLMAGVNDARHTAGVSVVSMSWGSGEFYGEQSYDSTFTTPAGHNGITFVAASGDDGRRAGPQYPASSPNVVAVGGTELQTSATGVYSLETGWTQTSGGYSSFEPEPAYQDKAQDSGVRSTPDVAYDAAPNTGFAVYDSIPYEGVSGWQEIGGASAGSPQWGALVAIADQTRAADKLSSLSGPTQTLPTLYDQYDSSATYAACFHDVTSGVSRSFGGAGPGYDLTTGLGSPQAKPLVQALSQPAATVAAVAQSETPASGLPFAEQLTHEVELLHGGTPAPPAPAAMIESSSVENVFISLAPAAGASGSSRGTSSTAASISSVFSEALIPQSASTSAPSRTSVQDLGASAATGTSAAAVNAPPSVASVAAPQSLAAWLGGGNASDVVLKLASAAPIGHSSDALIAAIAANAPAMAVAAAHGALTQIMPPIASLPGKIVYRFANFDPAATFADAMAAFAGESASISPIGAAPHASHRAWVITGAVLGADAILVGRWYVGRRQNKKQANATNPESPQAGPLPSGL